MNFTKRSYEKELLDRDDIPFEDIKLNMKELDYINSKLGGHSITLSGFRKLIKGLNIYPDGLRILEIGCGGGDNLRIIKKWAEEHDWQVKLTGVDINEQCIDYAKKITSNEGIEFICSDYKNLQFSVTPDIIFSSLFCHHFSDDDIVFMLNWMRKNSRVGFFINDLHRHLLAYYSIKWLAKFFSKSYLVKNDAPLSVLRGFKRKELEMFTARCSIYNAQLKWKWAFRWLLIYAHEKRPVI